MRYKIKIVTEKVVEFYVEASNSEIAEEIGEEMYYELGDELENQAWAEEHFADIQAWEFHPANDEEAKEAERGTVVIENKDGSYTVPMLDEKFRLVDSRVEWLLEEQ